MKIFVPLPGVTALRPLGTLTTKKLAWAEKTTDADTNVEKYNLEEIKQHCEAQVMAEKEKKEGNNNEETNSLEPNNDDDEKIVSDIVSVPLVDTKDTSKNDNLNNYQHEESEIKRTDTNSTDDDEKVLKDEGVPVGNMTYKGSSSRCTSSKTVKSVRFALPDESKGHSRRISPNKYRSICEPFFGIPNGPVGCGSRSRRPYSGWSITTTLNGNGAGFPVFSSMKSRGSMSNLKQVPGRYFPVPTTLEGKRTALQEAAKQSKPPRAKSAPLVASHNNFPRNPSKT